MSVNDPESFDETKWAKIRFALEDTPVSCFTTRYAIRQILAEAIGRLRLVNIPTVNTAVRQWGTPEQKTAWDKLQ